MDENRRPSIPAHRTGPFGLRKANFDVPFQILMPYLVLQVIFMVLWGLPVLECARNCG